MEKSKVEMFIASNINMLPAERMGVISEALEAADDSKYMVAVSIPMKDPITILLISIFFGSLGIDRFMLGDTSMGILKLLTGGLCGILYLIDIFRMIKLTKEHNYNKLMMFL